MGIYISFLTIFFFQFSAVAVAGTIAENNKIIQKLAEAETPGQLAQALEKRGISPKKINTQLTAIGSDGVQMQLLPSQTELPTHERKASTIVIVRNVTSSPIYDLELSWLTDMGIPFPLKENDALKNKLSAREEFAWVLEYSWSRTEHSPGTIFIRMDYKAKLDSEKTKTPRILVGSFNVGDGLEKSIPEDVSLKIEGSLDEISEFRDGSLYILVTNESLQPIKVHSVESSLPEGIHIRDPSIKDDKINILPKTVNINKPVFRKQTLSIPNRVTLDKLMPPQSGTHLLLFLVKYSWEKDGQNHQGSIVISKEISVGIPYITEMLTLIGVPVFFLLPGFLTIVTFKWVSKSLKKDSPDQLTLKQLANLSFWIKVITLSGFMLAAFNHFRFKRDLLKGYTFGDAQEVWLVSIALGIVLYFCHRTINKLLPNFFTTIHTKCTSFFIEGTSS
ncbi:MAG: hypothetical protein K0U54_12605 [Bacteroidetes bacterium]|nr:hypothetical protein [Bacteroidota bacterium]